MISTECKALNWMISKTKEYLKDEAHTVYQFRGNVPYRMMSEVTDWMRAQNAHISDGRTRTGYGLVVEENVDVENRWYKHTSIHVSRGSYKSTQTDVEVMITVYDCALTDEDIAEIKAAA